MKTKIVEIDPSLELELLKKVKNENCPRCGSNDIEVQGAKIVKNDKDEVIEILDIPHFICLDCCLEFL